MAMKQLFKLTLIFLCIWLGTRSLLKLSNPDQTTFEMIINFAVFTIFVGSPAASFWGSQIDSLFNDDKEDKNKNENID